MQLLPVTISGNYFLRGNQPFIPIGAHWIPANSGLQWPVEWDESELNADFSKMAELGFNTMRFDLFWAWVEPRPGSYNLKAFEQMDTFIRLANKYQIYLHPTFFIGGEVGEAFWDVPWRNGRHPHADPDLIYLQANHAAQFASRYCREPAILAWDLTDEPPFWIVGDQTTDEMAVNWTRQISTALRKYDPEHLICVGTNVEDLYHGPFRADVITEEVDFFSVHPYAIYSFDLFPDPMLSERSTYAAAFQTVLSAGAGHPVMIHEFGASSAQYLPDRIAAFDRTLYYSGLANGANGFLAWCYIDAAPKLFNRAPYLLSPHETQFGLTTWDRQDRPRGQALKNFSQILNLMDFNGIEPASGDAALIMPYEWSKVFGDQSHSGLPEDGPIPYTSTQDGFDRRAPNLWLMRSLLNAFVLARRAGLKVDMPREYENWQNYPLIFLPSPLTSTENKLIHLHTPFWDTARRFVERGGALYSSLCSDAAIPEMADLFGASLSDHLPANEITLTFIRDFGGLKAGAEFHYQADPSRLEDWPALLEVTDGEVLAEDSEGKPVLVSHCYGKGKTLLSAYPLEHYLACKPGGFEKPENTHQIYRAFADWAGITPLFYCDDPDVEVSGLVGVEHGYAILVNHQSVAKCVRVKTRLILKEVKQINNHRSQNLTLDDQSWEIEVPPYDGVIVEWRS